jgi:NAD(P)H-hydrate repair Nnr-like enzyme with NAD(P)H-hydrate epimerase domain
LPIDIKPYFLQDVKMKFYVLVITSLFFLAGCSRQAVDVYVTGYEEFEDGSVTAVYWKNGEKTTLSTNSDSAWAVSIVVNGSDVYVAGFETAEQGALQAVYWKNGEKTVLDAELKTIRVDIVSTWAASIAVSGSDVYTAGMEMNARSRFSAVYWKNGVKTYLSQEPLSSVASAITVVDSVVYIGGNDLNGEPAGVKAVYWKNGEKTVLSENSGNASVSAIAVSGGDIYIAGSEDAVNVYWKNGIKTALGDGTTVSLIDSIAVSGGGATFGGDVYTAGREITEAGKSAAVYWKNRKKTILTENNHSGFASAIRLNGSDCYVAGRDTDDNNVSSAVYWKNGAKVILPKDAGVASATANDIYIVEKN